MRIFRQCDCYNESISKLVSLIFALKLFELKNTNDDSGVMLKGLFSAPNKNSVHVFCEKEMHQLRQMPGKGFSICCEAQRNKKKAKTQQFYTGKHVFSD